jgi:hypothetical protein
MKRRDSAHDLIHRARYAVGSALDQELLDLSLTSRQLLVLAAVSAAEGASQMGLRIVVPTLFRLQPKGVANCSTHPKEHQDWNMGCLLLF